MPTKIIKNPTKGLRVTFLGGTVIGRRQATDLQLISNHYHLGLKIEEEKPK